MRAKIPMAGGLLVVDPDWSAASQERQEFDATHIIGASWKRVNDVTAEWAAQKGEAKEVWCSAAWVPACLAARRMVPDRQHVLRPPNAAAVQPLPAATGVARKTAGGSKGPAPMLPRNAPLSAPREESSQQRAGGGHDSQAAPGGQAGGQGPVGGDDKVAALIKMFEALVPKTKAEGAANAHWKTRAYEKAVTFLKRFAGRKDRPAIVDKDSLLRLVRQSDWAAYQPAQ